MGENKQKKVLIPPISEDTHFPKFQKPAIVGVFSLDSQRNYIEGPEYMKFLQLPQNPQVAFDLEEVNRVHKTTGRSSEEEDSQHRTTSELLHFLQWINKNETIFKERRPEFVMYRGLMSKILDTPYEDRQGWQIAALYKDGTIYLRNMDTEETTTNRSKFNNDPRLKKFASWGFNFERFLLSDSPGKSPDPLMISKEECNIIFRTKLGSHTVMYAAEIDGVWLRKGQFVDLKKNPSSLTECDLIELKTTREFHKGQMSYNFKKNNLRKWWCQSFTTGVKHVVVGFRNDAGIVKELKVFPLSTFPTLGKDWSGSVCFNFLEQFLTIVKKEFEGKESAVLVFDFCFNPAGQTNGAEILITEEYNSDKVLANLI